MKNLSKIKCKKKGWTFPRASDGGSNRPSLRGDEGATLIPSRAAALLSDAENEAHIYFSANAVVMRMRGGRVYEVWVNAWMCNCVCFEGVEAVWDEFVCGSSKYGLWECGGKEKEKGREGEKQRERGRKTETETERDTTYRNADRQRTKTKKPSTHKMKICIENKARRSLFPWRHSLGKTRRRQGRPPAQELTKNTKWSSTSISAMYRNINYSSRRNLSENGMICDVNLWQLWTRVIGENKID